MPYNNLNVLRRAIEIQTIVLKHQENGATQIWIYRNIVRDRFHISYSTFNRYLAVNAKKELKDRLSAEERP